MEVEGTSDIQADVGRSTGSAQKWPLKTTTSCTRQFANSPSIRCRTYHHTLDSNLCLHFPVCLAVYPFDVAISTEGVEQMCLLIHLIYVLCSIRHSEHQIISCLEYSKRQRRLADSQECQNTRHKEVLTNSLCPACESNTDNRVLHCPRVLSTIWPEA